MTRAKKNLGDWGEEQTVAFLIRNGFTVIDRNFYTTQGEIDIVAKKAGDYYFVEVKTRTDKDYANDLSITENKKHKLAKTIKQYCYKRNISGDCGLVLAGVLVLADRVSKTVKFHFNVFI